MATALHKNFTVSSPTEYRGPEFKISGSGIELEEHPKFMNTEKHRQKKPMLVSLLSDKVKNLLSTPDTKESDQV